MARSINRVVLLCGLSALAAAAEGCQRRPTWNLAPVEGTVTKGGRPLPHIEVVFVTDLDAGTQGPKASSFTDEAGHYRLQTDNGDDGAVVGKHRVLLSVPPKRRMGRRRGTVGGSRPTQAAQRPLEDAKRPQEQQIPPRYGRFDQTPLHAEIHPGPQTLDFDIP